MSKWSLGPSVMIALVAVACSGSAKPAPAAPTPAPVAPVAPVAPLVVEAPEPALPAIPSTPVAAPAELIVTASVPAPAVLVPALAAYVEHAMSGMGRQVDLDALTAAAIGAGFDPRGVDLGRPIWVLVLDPSRFHRPFVVVAGLGDEAALAAQVKEHDLRYQLHHGRVAIGARDALAEVGGYALTTLVDAPVPAWPTVDVDVAYLMQHYGSTLDGLLETGTATQPADQQAMTLGVLRAYVGLFAQLDHARLTFETDGGLASVGLRLAPLPGTALATFIGRQLPATFAELERLPPGVMSIGGRLDLRGAFDTMMAAMQPMMVKTYGEGMAEMMTASQRWIGLAAGDNGLTADVGPGRMEMSGVLHVDDPAAMRAIWTDLVLAIGRAKGGATTIATASATYKRIKLSTISVTLAPDAPAEQRKAFESFGGKLQYGFAVVDQAAVFAMGAAAPARVKALIDRVRAGKKPTVVATAGLLAALTDARARHESYVMAMDVAAVTARFLAPALGPPAPSGAIAPAVFALGTDGGALTMRTSLPAAQLGALLGMRAQLAQRDTAEVDAALATFDHVADEVCKCIDAACVQKAMEQIAAMKEPARKPNEAELARAIAIASRMAACQKRLMATPAPSTAPTP